MFKRAKGIIIKPCSLQTNAGRIDYLLKRSSRRRTFAISVDEKSLVCVSAPSYSPEKELLDFIRLKAKWILDRVKEAQKNQHIIKKRKFDHGQKFLFLGKKYMLNVVEDDVKRVRLDLNETEWMVQIPLNLESKDRQELIKKKLIQWYRLQAEEILGGRLFHFAREIGVEPKKIAIRTQKRVWGNCDYSAQTIHLNWQIILSPIEVIDYVVVHELCHLLVPSHTKRFWKKVEKILPDFKSRKKWLKSNSLEMSLI